MEWLIHMFEQNDHDGALFYYLALPFIY